ncbi:hypothetical protein BREVNS_0267 [Brevinematales bacterium NS]|nr:hypothetical protein BREVNS_0267 [Brevinematales bacterium NS]
MKKITRNLDILISYLSMRWRKTFLGKIFDYVSNRRPERERKG